MARHVDPIIIALMTTKDCPYLTWLPVRFRRKTGQIVLNQIRTVDKLGSPYQNLSPTL